MHDISVEDRRGKSRKNKRERKEKRKISYHLEHCYVANLRLSVENDTLKGFPASLNA